MSEEKKSEKRDEKDETKKTKDSPEIVKKDWDWDEYKAGMRKAKVIYNKEAPETKPYTYRYEAREIQEGFLNRMKVLPKDTKIREEIGRLYYLLGRNYYLCEEIPGAQFRLENAIKELKLNQSDRDCTTPFTNNVIFELMDSFNYLGMIWYHRKAFYVANENFKKSEKIYIEVVPCLRSPKKDEVDLEKNEILLKACEECYTFSCFFLTQTYGNLKNRTLSAKYSVKTLKRQYSLKMDFDPFEWAINAGVLSSYFISIKNFSMAEHCLKAARVILPQKQNVEVEANIYLLFGQFYTALLNESKIFLKEFRDSERRKEKRLNEDVKEENEFLKYPKEKIRMGVKNDFETFESIVTKPSLLQPLRDIYHISSIDEAVVIFKKCVKCYKFAKKFYKLDGYVSDHIKIVGNLSTSYCLLSFFEPNYRRRIAMQEKRSALLLPIVSQLSKVVYLDTMKQLTFELTEIYSTILEEYNYLENKEENVKRKINETAMQVYESVKNFKDLFFDPIAKLIKVEKDNRPAYLTAIFYLASAYYKMLPDTWELREKFLVLSMMEFEKIEQFVAQEKMTVQEKKKVDVEISLAKEMVTLIPYKIKEMIDSRKNEEEGEKKD